jgi:hypothetical protein
MEPTPANLYGLNVRINAINAADLAETMRKYNCKSNNGYKNRTQELVNKSRFYKSLRANETLNWAECIK